MIMIWMLKHDVGIDGVPNTGDEERRWVTLLGTLLTARSKHRLD